VLQWIADNLMETYKVKGLDDATDERVHLNIEACMCKDGIAPGPNAGKRIKKKQSRKPKSVEKKPEEQLNNGVKQDKTQEKQSASGDKPGGMDRMVKQQRSAHMNPLCAT
jgi:hypothetical protein